VITVTHSEDFTALKTLVYKMCYEIVHVQQLKQAQMYEGTNEKKMHSTTADIHCIIKSAT
jgi:spore coat polysaccharide biosynthesis protein SpsF (cytidylyltransferase family)